jgi:hypothetical protein
MSLTRRTELLRRIQQLRGGRTIVCLCAFDRAADHPAILPNSHTYLTGDTAEPLFRTLADTTKVGQGLDVFLYTRGGDPNAVTPIVNVLREFDPDFHVFVPHRCHSAGTLVALAAKRIHMTCLAELTPIDPAMTHALSPVDPQGRLVPISMQELRAYSALVNRDSSGGDATIPALEKVHPLVLSNVQRVHRHVRFLARGLLAMHEQDDIDPRKVVATLLTGFYTHQHTIGRHEARRILGSKVEFVDGETSQALDALLRCYQDEFSLLKPFYIAGEMGDTQRKEIDVVGAIVESEARTYSLVARASLRQASLLLPGYQIQVIPGQGVPLIPGQPREYRVEILSRQWQRSDG